MPRLGKYRLLIWKLIDESDILVQKFKSMQDELEKKAEVHVLQIGCAVKC